MYGKTVSVQCFYCCALLQKRLKPTSGYKCSSLPFSHALHWIASTHSIVSDGTELWPIWRSAPGYHEAMVGFRSRAISVLVTSDWRAWMILIIVCVKLFQQLRRLGWIAIG